MDVLLYLLVPLLIVGLVATIMWFRNRQPTSLQAGVDSFRREMEALSPDSQFNRRRDPNNGDQPGTQGSRIEPTRRRPERD